MYQIVHYYWNSTEPANRIIVFDLMTYIRGVLYTFDDYFTDVAEPDGSLEANGDYARWLNKTAVIYEDIKKKIDFARCANLDTILYAHSSNSLTVNLEITIIDPEPECEL